MTVELSAATLADAPFLSMVLMEALSHDALQVDGTLKPSLTDTHRQMTALVERGDTLYSWHHGTVARIGGVAVGGTIAYPGDEYHARRVTTFTLVRHLLQFDESGMEDEARSGEHYLDSLAVLPPWRGAGVARALLRGWMEQARACGLAPTLAVHPGNMRARRLYTEMGLHEAGLLFIFGEDYLRMQG